MTKKNKTKPKLLLDTFISFMLPSNFSSNYPYQWLVRIVFSFYNFWYTIHYLIITERLGNQQREKPIDPSLSMFPFHWSSCFRSSLSGRLRRKKKVNRNKVYIFTLSVITLHMLTSLHLTLFLFLSFSQVSIKMGANNKSREIKIGEEHVRKNQRM